MYVLQLFYSSFIYFCLLLFLYVVSGSTLKEFIKRMKKKRRLFALLFCVCVCVCARCTRFLTDSSKCYDQSQNNRSCQGRKQPGPGPGDLWEGDIARLWQCENTQGQTQRDRWTDELVSFESVGQTQCPHNSPDSDRYQSSRMSPLLCCRDIRSSWRYVLPQSVLILFSLSFLLPFLLFSSVWLPKSQSVQTLCRGHQPWGCTLNTMVCVCLCVCVE